DRRRAFVLPADVQNVIPEDPCIHTGARGTPGEGGGPAYPGKGDHTAGGPGKIGRRRRRGGFVHGTFSGEPFARRGWILFHTRNPRRTFFRTGNRRGGRLQGGDHPSAL